MTKEEALKQFAQLGAVWFGNSKQHFIMAGTGDHDWSPPASGVMSGWNHGVRQGFPTFICVREK